MLFLCKITTLLLHHFTNTISTQAAFSTHNSQKPAISRSFIDCLQVHCANLESFCFVVLQPYRQPDSFTCHQYDSMIFIKTCINSGSNCVPAHFFKLYNASCFLIFSLYVLPIVMTSYETIIDKILIVLPEFKNITDLRPKHECFGAASTNNSIILLVVLKIFSYSTIQR